MALKGQNLMRPPATAGLCHVALNVRDLEVCERFYTELLGMRVEWRPDADTRIFMTPAWARIHSHDSSIEDSAPPFSFSLLLDRKIDDNWRASAGYYHSGAMTWLAGGSRVPASDRLDARLAYQTRVSGKAVEFWLTGQSLLGGQTEFEQFQEGERRFLAGARVEW